MLLGDGSINNDNGYRITHCGKQKEYLQWKINLLHENGIKTCGLKSYVSSKGYKVGETYYYTRLAVMPFIKVLRRVFYKPKKNIANRKLLNRLDARGVAIWFMDDGCINHRNNKGRKCGFYIRIATCLSKEQNQIIIDYFKEVWNIHFYTISEGKGTYSLCCGTTEGIKFIEIVKPFVEEIPSMKYKISFTLDRKRILRVGNLPKKETPL